LPEIPGQRITFGSTIVADQYHGYEVNTIMNKLLVSVFLAVSLTGCASIQSMIPSFWDDNQSARIIDVRQKVELIDCAQEQRPQIDVVAREIRWFQLYSESKGQRQQDVLKIVAPMQETVGDWQKRGEGSKSYCELKKRTLALQSERAAQAILGRF
jgi:hypothetical protein